MSYHFSKIIKGKSFNDTIEYVTAALKVEGFGVLTEIDIQATLKKRINIDMKQYKILGACNPQFAYKAITAEDKIGVFLPCNVVVQEHENGMIEVSAVDPIASMVSVQNEGLAPIAAEVQQKIKRVIYSL
ncbi:MAG: DUF302 domain-containing protein [Bacteroidetes bacterium]|nr:DUF302 domain-containing protein [Bacteroidota bacterium]NCQ10747.1 DUF302 domain-containing protein [Bacteroidota bacterium]